MARWQALMGKDQVSHCAQEAAPSDPVLDNQAGRCSSQLESHASPLLGFSLRCCGCNPISPFSKSSEDLIKESSEEKFPAPEGEIADSGLRRTPKSEREPHNFFFSLTCRRLHNSGESLRSPAPEMARNFKI